MTVVTPDTRIDWFRVLTDLCQDGGSLYQVSRITSIPRSSLQSYRLGVEPSHSVGSCLLRLWAITTGNDRDDAPTVERMPSVSVMRRA
jgi:hypothetical protein